MTDFPGLGLDDRAAPPEAKSGARPAGRSTPPFRRRSRAPLAPSGSAPGPPGPPRLEGLSRGGTADVLSGASAYSRYTPAAASLGFHLVLAALFLGGLAPFPEAEPEPAVVEAEREPLLYAFEAPPLEEPAVLAEAPVEPPPEPLPEPDAVTAEAQPAPPPAAGLVIPEAQIATPNTGFQNDLPFADGEDEEFYFDERMGEDPDSDAADSESPTDFAPDAALSAAELAALAAEAEAAALLAPEPEPAVEAAPAIAEAAPPDGLPDPRSEPLFFDEDAFRERINDPAAEVRRRGDEMAFSKARALAERERRREGVPTDIWRFLEGKRFRNPEGGLVSNRNNTLYYDDRGANLVPWISRLIAEVRSNWYVPYAASYERGHVAIAINVLRSGELAWLQVVIPSGVPGFDNAAVGALRGARLLPLPDDYPGADFEIMLVFWYNERPYDLFNR